MSRTLTALLSASILAACTTFTVEPPENEPYDGPGAKEWMPLAFQTQQWVWDNLVEKSDRTLDCFWGTEVFLMPDRQHPLWENCSNLPENTIACAKAYVVGAEMLNTSVFVPAQEIVDTVSEAELARVLIHEFIHVKFACESPTGELSGNPEHDHPIWDEQYSFRDQFLEEIAQ